MKKILIGVLVGMGIGLSLGWYLTEGQRRKEIRQTQDKLAAEATKAATAVRDAIADIRAEDINLHGTPVRQPELERDEVHDLAV